jgi:hypothetical protein
MATIHAFSNESDAPSPSHEMCGCGAMWIGPDSPHTLHGIDRAHVIHQVIGAPEYGREAHTVRECYREVCAGESWTLALAEWKESLRDGGRPLPAPMPVGHLLFAPVPGSSALSRRDNTARKGAEVAS